MGAHASHETDTESLGYTATDHTQSSDDEQQQPVHYHPSASSSAWPAAAAPHSTRSAVGAAGAAAPLRPAAGRQFRSQRAEQANHQESTYGLPGGPQPPNRESTYGGPGGALQPLRESTYGEPDGSGIQVASDPVRTAFSRDPERLGQKAERPVFAPHEDTGWANDLMLTFWPHVCNMIGEKIKDALKKYREKVPELDATVDQFVTRYAKHPLTLPLTTTWINTTLADIWSLLRPVIELIVHEAIVPDIRERLPKMLQGIDIKPCTIGRHPPRVKRISTKHRRDYTIEGKKDNLNLQLDFEWKSDLDVGVVGPFGKLKLGLKSFFTSFRVHLSMMELLNEPPFFAGIGVYMASPPEFELHWTGALECMDNATVDHMLQSYAQEAISKIMVLPKRIAVPLSSSDLHSVFRVVCPRPQGVLKISNLRAYGLTKKKVHLSTFWSQKKECLSFVNVVMGGSHWKTAVQRTRTVADTGAILPPSGMYSKADDQVGEAVTDWEDEYYFFVDEPHDQSIDFHIVDHGPVRGDEPLARVRGQKLLDLLNVSERDRRRLDGMEWRRDTEKTISLKPLWGPKPQAPGAMVVGPHGYAVPQSQAPHAYGENTPSARLRFPKVPCIRICGCYGLLKFWPCASPLRLKPGL
eukprot:TRINITY_DN14233_c0_g6_i1.p1 TRINITY_DN14233_c0_g6~~TRINITY_DN14233_c0_g6_i1.p1  ORF type:complete len:638 (+),score=98.36 TRINITY_DN14233_c0_g6_i1:101-2014(+)